MKLDKPHGLLYIEPTRKRSNEPVEDKYTKTIDNLVTKAVNDKKYGIFNKTFEPDCMYLGVHTCVCGEKSLSCDLKITDKYATNSLAPHYLRFHRDEIPVKEFKKLDEILSSE